MAPRLDLQERLVEILGSPNVYFQPPADVTMVYPCFVYKLSDIRNTHAGNRKYHSRREYQVTVIDRNPDSPLVEQINNMLTARFDRHFVSDGLNHFVFTLFY